MSELAIVTGASSNHFQPLLNLLYTIALFEPHTKTVVYDLGLKSWQHKEIKKHGYEVCRFRFDRYPPHLNIRVDRGQYAWKPVIVADMLAKTNGHVLWLDAGNLIHRRLDKVRAILDRYGLYSPRSEGRVAQWTHPDTLRFLGAAPDLLLKRNRNGAIVGLAAARPEVSELAERWRACALQADCIAPPGSSRSNHRQDQAVLTVLAYQFQKQCGCKLESRLLDISIHNDLLLPADVQRKIGRQFERTGL